MIGLYMSMLELHILCIWNALRFFFYPKISSVVDPIDASERTSMLFCYPLIKATPRHRGIVVYTRLRVYIMQIDSIDWSPDSSREYRLVARFSGSIPVSKACSPCNLYFTPRK